MGDTKTQIADTSAAIDYALSVLNRDALTFEGFASLAQAAKSLAETLVLLQQVAANESAQRLTDAIVKKYESAETVPIVAVVPGGVS